MQISKKFSNTRNIKYSSSGVWLLLVTILFNQHYIFASSLPTSTDLYNQQLIHDNCRKFKDCKDDSTVLAKNGQFARSDIKLRYNPVIFVPGDGGSQLEARLNKTQRVHYVCDLVSDWFDIWLNLHLLTPVFIDCVYDNMRLHYNATTRSTHNTDGVDIRAYQFGSLQSVSYLDRYRIPKTDYFETIVATLEKENKLAREIDMRGAPFDFRKAPNELPEFFKNLSDLIEEQYIASDYRPVTLVCHSMGCLNSVLLLNQKSDTWKDIHIKRLITLGAPWSGSFKAISAMLFGDNLGIPLLDAKKLGVLESSFPSLMYLFPTPPTYLRNRTLIQTPKMNYTLDNFDDFLKIVKLQDQMDMWHDVRDLGPGLKAPNVEIWCLYGSGQQTPTKIVVKSNITDDISKWAYEELQGDGDGTVNIESLEACKQFRSGQTKPVYLRKFDNIDHIDILRSKDPGLFIAQNILKYDLDLE